MPSSELINAGVAITTITDDAIGVPDIGAFEGASPAGGGLPPVPLNTELIRNGGFEQPGSTQYIGWSPTENVPDWQNGGTTGSFVGTSSANPAEGGWHAQISSGGWNSRSIAQTTDYTIQSGDKFSLTFRYNITEAFNPDASLRVFYRDNGEWVPFHTWTDSYDWWSNKNGNTDPNDQPWQTYSISDLAVPAEAVGHPIGVWFTNAVASQQVYIDDVSLIRTEGPTGGGLQAQWKFNEGSGWTAGDSSGNGFNGDLFGPTWVGSGGGYKLDFDGNDDYLNIPDKDILNNVKATTLTGWVKVRDVTQSANLIFISTDSSNTSARAHLEYRADKTLKAGGRSTDGESYQYAQTTSTITLWPQWTFMAAVIDYENDTIKVYMNGVKEVEQTVNFSSTTTPSTDSSCVNIGAQDFGNSKPLNGEMNDVRVYTRVLSDSEIMDLYNNQGE